MLKFPKQKKELMDMLAADQREIKSASRSNKAAERFEENRREREQALLTILDIIGAPSVSKIGADGCQALSVLAIHSTLETMQKVLKAFEDSCNDSLATIPTSVIPPLADKVRIGQGKKQIFGTQWTQGKNGDIFLIAVEDFDKANILRERYELGPIMRPINLSSGEAPLGRGRAQKSDQREFTQEEREEYTKHYLI